MTSYYMIIYQICDAKFMNDFCVQCLQNIYPFHFHCLRKRKDRKIREFRFFVFLTSYHLYFHAIYVGRKYDMIRAR